MSASNKGKEFENRFRKDFLNSLLNSTIDRLYDPSFGYKSISNISDFIGYCKPNIFYLECKTHSGASLPFENITQYDKLVQKVGIPGVRVGVILWLYDKNVIYYIPISTIKLMKEDGKKSVGLKAITEGYNIKEIPIISKKRLYAIGDYSILMTLSDGE